MTIRRYLHTGLTLLLLGCTTTPPEEQAAKAARDYYQYLVDGRAVEFLESKAEAGQWPAGYGEQLLRAVKQYCNDMNNKHDGLRSVEVSPNVGRRDTTLRLTYAFLLLNFGDSTQEEVVVPMIEHNGEWRMR